MNGPGTQLVLNKDLPEVSQLVSVGRGIHIQICFTAEPTL